MNQPSPSEIELVNTSLDKFSGLRRSLSRTWIVAKRLTPWPARKLRGLVLSAKNAGTPSHHLTLAARLPPELIDHIIDYFHCDKDTLLTLSLVCRALVPSVRYHLFDRLKVTNSNAKQISALFTEETHDIALYVRELTLEAGIGRSDEVFEELRAILSGKKLRPLLRSFFLVVAPRARNVTRLILKAVPLEKSIIGMLTLCFPKLNMLSLFDCSFRCNADLDRLVRDHPTIHTLRAGRLCSINGLTSSEPTDTLGPPLVLHQLKVTEAFSPAPLTLTPWLVAHCNPQHFIYTLYRLDQFVKINAGIIQMESLTHLHLIIYHWRREEMYEVEVEPSLVSLTPRYPPTITTMTLDGKMHMLNLVVTILAQLDPHAFVHLHTLNLWVHLEETDVSKVDPGMWLEMDRTLSVLLSLGVVNFYNSCQTKEHIHAGSEAIEARLSILKIRGMLRFRDLEPPF
ncbi:hypothetical protein K466DRAFT_523839 [Polyporus arcularius HHB13444]|uniref:F-box domain-containing protein n=1 Tax=Polyporus arcularius HHB13444 TaxID=1314778 RepID=A0A5C3PEJ7_9APHY|nr:hypothetical protein K466DRAFT_523839 [Polyporus arcularius HHB13444]